MNFDKVNLIIWTKALERAALHATMKLAPVGFLTLD